MRDNIIQKKSYDFALRIVNLYKQLTGLHKEYVLSNQILRSGTAVGANVEEAIGGQSKKDFSSKMAIAYKEARETHYWLRILRDTGFIDNKTSDSLILLCEELLRIISAIQKSVRPKISNK